MKNPLKKINVLLLAMIYFILILTGCSSGVLPSGNKYPRLSIGEIAKTSPAASYLASLVENCDGFIFIEDKNSENPYSYLYDNAAAIIALAAVGADWHALKIADTLVYAMGHDRTFSDGRLRNAYMGGSPKNNSGRFFSGDLEYVRLPGFWAGGQWHEDYYSVSTSSGNMAWALLALCAAANIAQPEEAAKYTKAAVYAADFLLNFRSPTGGFTGGYEGWDNEQTKVKYKSTEHNIDIVGAFAAISKLVSTEFPEKALKYKEAADYAKTFVLSMYDDELYCFYTGTEDDDETISKGVIPLDANTWALLVLGKSFSEADKVMTFIEKNMSVGSGFDFSAGDLDGIWNEGTAQMAVCYSVLGNSSAYDTIMAYLQLWYGFMI